MRCSLFFPLFFFLMIPTSAFACAWDEDTRWQERFFVDGMDISPRTLHFVFGRFLHHSKAFYRWRVQDRLKKLKTNPKKLDYYDDLGVAYDKLGKRWTAIRTMRKKEKIKAGGYKTIANLGTFYIHAGRLKRGLRYINKAIKINPNAHFGREIIQHRLVKFLISLKDPKKKLKLPLSENSGYFQTFRKFISEEENRFNPYKGAPKAKNITPKEVSTGLLGMMQFGNYRSPVLLEALAHMFDDNQLYDATDNPSNITKALLYKLASIRTRGKTRKAYKKMEDAQFEYISDAKRSQFYRLFWDTWKESKQWIKHLHTQEKAWLKAGKNADKMFFNKFIKPKKQTIFASIALLTNYAFRNKSFFELNYFPKMKQEQKYKKVFQELRDSGQQGLQRFQGYLLRYPFPEKTSIQAFHYLAKFQPGLAKQVFDFLSRTTRQDKLPRWKRKKAMRMLRYLAYATNKYPLSPQLRELHKKPFLLPDFALLLAKYQHQYPTSVQHTILSIKSLLKRRRKGSFTMEKLVEALSMLAPNNTESWMQWKNYPSYRVRAAVVRGIQRNKLFSKQNIRYLSKRYRRGYRQEVNQAMKALWSWKSKKKQATLYQMYRKSSYTKRKKLLTFLLNHTEKQGHSLLQYFYVHGKRKHKRQILLQIRNAHRYSPSLDSILRSGRKEKHRYLQKIAIKSTKALAILNPKKKRK